MAVGRKINQHSQIVAPVRHKFVTRIRQWISRQQSRQHAFRFADAIENLSRRSVNINVRGLTGRVAKNVIIPEMPAYQRQTSRPFNQLNPREGCKFFVSDIQIYGHVKAGTAKHTCVTDDPRWYIADVREAPL